MRGDREIKEKGRERKAAMFPKWEEKAKKVKEVN
jgi:hypothetical protein